MLTNIIRPKKEVFAYFFSEQTVLLLFFFIILGIAAILNTVKQISHE